MVSLTRLTLCFQCYYTGPLFTRVHGHGNLCCTSNLLRLGYDRVHILRTAYGPINSLENVIITHRTSWNSVHG